MNTTIRVSFIITTIILFLAAAFVAAPVVRADHSWSTYHWARTTSSFTLKLGDNVNATWDAYLAEASADWNPSAVVDTVVVPGTAGRNCKATTGMVQVCNNRYGNNGWLGIASIYVSGSHITKGTVKLNDTYFNTSTYNKPAWRGLVACQEVAHTLGLNHQDEAMSNTNLGSCMDYTNDPDGTIYGQLSNRYPNSHDFDQLLLIYAHVDTTSTVASTKAALTADQADDSEDPKTWGKEIRRSKDGHSSVFEKDLGNGNKVVRHVFWVEGRARDHQK